MKILKRFLIIGLFSFIFLIGNVYASTSNYTMNIKYGDTFYQQVINANDRINKLHNYLENKNNGNICFDNICNNINSGNVALIYRYIDTDNWLVSLVNNNYMKTFYSSSNVNNSYMQIFFSNMTQFKVAFNSNNDITSFSGYMTGSDNLWFSLSGIDINNSDYTAYQLYKYVDAYYLNDNQIIQYNSGSGGIDIKLNINNNIYTPVVNINAKELFDSMIPTPPEPEDPNKCLIANQLGTTENIDSLQFRVQGTTNALDYPITGFFEINSRTFNGSSNIDWSTYVNASAETFSQAGGNIYNVEFDISYIELNDNITKIIRLDYKITAEDDVETNVDVVFNITDRNDDFKPFFTNKLYIFGCPYKNIYSNISYGFKNGDTGTYSSTDFALINMMNNESSPDLGMFNNIRGILPQGPIDSILTLPLSVLNSLQNALGLNCSSLNVSLPFVNRNITLTCIRTFYTNTGFNTFFETTGVIASILILLQYFIFLYNWIDDILRLGHKKLTSWGTGEI